jgi:hypothetical protein
VAVAGLTSRISFILGNHHQKAPFHFRIHLALFLLICFNEYTADNSYRQMFSSIFIPVFTCGIPLLASIFVHRIYPQNLEDFPTASLAEISKRWHLSKLLGIENLSIVLRLRNVRPGPLVGKGEHVHSTLFLSDPPPHILITNVDQA